MNEDITLLYHLSKSLKTRDGVLRVSSSQLGDLLGVSQQTASRYLISLEKKGLVKRRRIALGQEITLTEKGVELLWEVNLDLQRFFSSTAKKEVIEGLVSKGIGEGAYYIKEYSDEIKKRLNFTPFPGTLNVKFTGEFDLERLAPNIIRGFRREGRTFGLIRYAPVRLHAENKFEDCYLVVPVRTHHRDVLELISEYNLRSRLSLEDNDKVLVEFI